MGFNWQTFKTRSLTATVFVVIMLGGLLWNRWSFFILFSIIHFGAWNEYQKLGNQITFSYSNISPFHKIGVTLAGWSMMLFFTDGQFHIGIFSLQQLGLWTGFILLTLLPLSDLLYKRFFVLNFCYSLGGLLYISLPLALMIDLKNRWGQSQQNLSALIPLLLIFSLWINDSFAYIIGSMIGKTPLSPISPKKTWEGTIGGILLTVVASGLASYFLRFIPTVHAVLIAALSSISGTFGDLFESKLKRWAGVKDSGQIMPGHGGFLDRFDSLFFASICIWFYVIFFIAK
ncbi:MAG: phosphatidate cytidylyltransferase [Flavisolibacter sp.]